MVERKDAPPSEDNSGGNLHEALRQWRGSLVKAMGIPASDRQRSPLECSSTYPRLVAEGFGGSHPNEEDWRVLRQHNELILNAAGEGIYGIDTQGRAIFVNPAAAQMTGHQVRELLGQSMHDVVHHSHADGRHYPREECPIYAAFKDGLVRHVGEDVFWHKNGSSFRVEYTSTPITSGGELLGAVVVFRDITRRCETEERLRRALAEVRSLKEQLQQENTTLRREISTVRDLQSIVGRSSVLRETQRLIARVAPLDSTILIRGETGVGKELVAQSLHALSRRSAGPLVRLNCGALPSQLADSELFGHEQGAFTGAVKRRQGRFEQASGGTLFLDEVGELPLETQTKLLRVLQEHEYERVGGNTTMAADVRVVAATNRDLEQAVREGTFRSDLYFRLNVLPIYVPPLRDRVGDIPELANTFLQQLEVRYGRRLGRFASADMERLVSYPWPGNVRELQNLVERAALLSDGAVISLPADFCSGKVRSTATNLSAHSSMLTREPPPSASPPSDAGGTGRLEDIERQHILQVLENTRWRLSGPSGASEILGLHPNTLRHRMKKLGIQR